MGTGEKKNVDTRSLSGASVCLGHGRSTFQVLILVPPSLSLECPLLSSSWLI